jgi:peptidoglycan/xylan/chitin deacetylase (PgdA/CDA1 family)
MTPTLDLLIGGSAVSAAAIGAAYWATYGVRSQWLGATAWRGSRNLAAVALTFDDGPTEDTERILDTLEDSSVRAAFFMLGRQVARYPHIARRIVDAGHEIGNHSYSHPVYLFHGSAQIRRELERTQEVIADVTGVRPLWSRPPYGVRSPGYFRAARALGLRTVQWSVTGYDWKPRPASAIARAVARGLDAGAIVLLHDGDGDGTRDRRPTVEALPAIVDAVTTRGLVVAPLAMLLRTC